MFTGKLWKRNESAVLHLSYHLDFPVDVPLFHVAEAPGLDSISSAGVHPDQTVVSDTDQLLPLPTLEPTERNRTVHCRRAVSAAVCTTGRVVDRDISRKDTWVFIRLESYLARKWVIPNSGRDCHAWMKRIFASMRLIWATFWWASRIRAEIWQKHKHTHIKHVSSKCSQYPSQKKKTLAH